MGRTRRVTRNHNHDNDGEASSSRKKPRAYPCWSDLDNDLLGLVMMLLGGVFEYYSFRGVCKSWRSFAFENENKFMASMPPMSIRIFRRALKRTCYIEDFQGRHFKTILPDFAVGDCIGLTCGYLVFFAKETRDFWLVNPLTRKQRYFPDFPLKHRLDSHSKAMLVFSLSISEWVFVVLCRAGIWFCVEGKGVWTDVDVPDSAYVHDLCAFKGRIYTLSFDRSHPVVHKRFRLCELRLHPDPNVTLLETRKPFFGPMMFVSSCDSLFVANWDVKTLYELDVGEMEWVKPCEKTIDEYSFFLSKLNDDVVAVRQESWADPRPHTDKNTKYKLFTEKMWYFPHQSVNVDLIDE